VLKLSSNVSVVFPKVLKLSSEVSECKPLVLGLDLGQVLGSITRKEGIMEVRLGDSAVFGAAFTGSRSCQFRDTVVLCSVVSTGCSSRQPWMSMAVRCVSRPMCLRAAEDAGNHDAVSPGRVRSYRCHPPVSGGPSTRDVSACHDFSPRRRYPTRMSVPRSPCGSVVPHAWGQ